MRTNSSIFKMLGRKVVMVVLLAITTIGAFATLGDGKTKNTNPGKKLLSIKTSYRPGSFSLNPGYNFRGSQVISTQEKETQYINLNTPITYQNGHTSYIVPLKKKVVLNDKIVFNPNAATRR
jgi:hypothetical protein